MEKLFTNICQSVGLRLYVLGSQLMGFRVFTFYQPEGNPYVMAIHSAVDESNLNSSMRSYVENLDNNYHNR